MTEELVNRIRSRWEAKNKRDLGEHIRHDPTDTIESYLANLEAQWAGILSTRLRIYLDQRIWIDVQRTVSGRPRNDTSRAMYLKLKELVQGGEAVCPISSATYWELTKQLDRQSRLETAKVIDHLSGGFSTKSGIEVLEIEAENLINSKMDTFRKVWQRVGMVEYSPTETILGHSGMRLLVDLKPLERRKFLAEILSEMTLEEFVSSVSPLTSIVTNMETAIRNETERIRQEDTRENYDDFQALHRFELAGALRAAGTRFQTAHPGAMDYGNSPSLAQVLQDKDAIRRTIPMSYASSGLHALLRSDPKRKYTKNDYFDIQHSSFGVAFCDILLTERSFGHLLRQGPLFLADFYETQVLSKDREIMEYLSSLSP